MGVLVTLALTTAAGPALAGQNTATAPESTEPAPGPAEPDDVAADEVEPEPEPAVEDGGEDLGPEEEIRPPRIDGTYLNMTAFGGLGFARVNDFGTGGAFAAFGGSAGIGQMVFPWLGLGLQGGGSGGVSSGDGARQTLGQGYLGIEFKFVPAPKKIPLSLMAGFGFGGGAVRQEGIEARSGYGGAQFGAAVRYELFPFAKRFRPYRGGGFGLGPQLGWLGFTPAAADRPMSNIIYLALSATFYFGS